MVGADCPKIPLEDSTKKWQNSFFYVHNLGADHMDLSAFAITPPQAKTNWGYSPRHSSQEIINLCERVTVMRTQEGLTGTDLLAAFITRRVLPALEVLLPHRRNDRPSGPQPHGVDAAVCGAGRAGRER